MPLDRGFEIRPQTLAPTIKSLGDRGIPVHTLETGEAVRVYKRFPYHRNGRCKGPRSPRLDKVRTIAARVL